MNDKELLQRIQIELICKINADNRLVGLTTWRDGVYALADDGSVYRMSFLRD